MKLKMITRGENMRVLHYFLGFAPYRSGGLTKYATDLMREQVKCGNFVMALWPGRYTYNHQRVAFKKKIIEHNFESYELCNPLPIPLLNGINNIAKYTAPTEEFFYRNFLYITKPDIIHIHTFMGLHKEFLKVSSNLEIPVVYTTHDYFGICPKTSLYKDNKICVNCISSSDCVQCNEAAFGMNVVKLMQSPLYRFIKPVFCKFAMRNAVSFIKKYIKHSTVTRIQSESETNLLCGGYKELRNYYLEMFEDISCFVFNSPITKNVFTKNLELGNKPYEILPVTHADLYDRREEKIFRNIIRIGFMGQLTRAKGFECLIDVLDETEAVNKKIELHIYDSCDIRRKYLVKHKKYNYKELQDIYRGIDVLIVPSMWLETFGFTALEAKSFGVPVIMTENVGAKCCFENYVDGIIVEPSKAGIRDAIINIVNNHTILENINQNILGEVFSNTMIEHQKKVMEIYKQIKIDNNSTNNVL